MSHWGAAAAACLVAAVPIRAVDSGAVAGPIEFALSFPAARTGSAEPLLATGNPGRGDTLFVHYEAPGVVRFGWDSSASGAVYSEPVPVIGAGPHHLLVSMGSLQPPLPKDASPTSAESLLTHMMLVQFDGKLVLRYPGDFQPIQGPADVSWGTNRIGSALVKPFFTGHLEAPHSVPAEQVVAEAMQLARWVAPPGSNPAWPGAVRLRVRFSAIPSDAGDPIIVTGRTGVGDFLYSQVPDSGHIRFGFDHWAVGGSLTPPIAIDFGVVHDLILTMGSLYGPGDRSVGPWRTHVAIWLDGTEVLSTESPCHPTTLEQVILGYNLIGGSTTDFVFRGLILNAVSVSAGTLAPR